MRGQRLLRALSHAQLGLVAVGAVALAWLAVRDRLTVPFVDDWRLLDDLASLSLPAYLFTPQNGHHLPVTLGLFALDHAFFGGRSRLLVAASLACLALCGWALFRAFRAHDGLSAPLSRITCCFACFALLWAASSHDLLWGLNQHNPQVAALLLLGVLAVARASPGAGGQTWRRLAPAALCALLASFSFGIGAAAWAALLAGALLRRLPARAVLGLAAAALATALARGLSIPPHPKISLGRSFGALLSDPLEVGAFALALLGSAPARVALALGLGPAMPGAPGDLAAWQAYGEALHRIAVVCGALGVAFAAVRLAAPLRRRVPAPPLETFALSLLAFGVAVAALVAFVRWPFYGGAHSVAIRWITWSTLFWVAAVCSLLPRPGAGVRVGRAAWLAPALVAVTACLIPAQRDARLLHALRHDQASRLALALNLGVRNDRLAASVALDEPDLVYRVTDRLAPRRRHPFDDPRRELLGTPLVERFEAVAGCAGRFERRALSTRDGSAAAVVRGSAHVPEGLGALRYVVLCDDAGSIRGVADPEAPRPRSGRPPGETRWTGFVVPHDAARSYTAWAVLGDARRACRLSVSAAPQATRRAPAAFSMAQRAGNATASGAGNYDGAGRATPPGANDPNVRGHPGR